MIDGVPATAAVREGGNDDRCRREYPPVSIFVIAVLFSLVALLQCCQTAMNRG
jgi:hypothetical protein